MEFPCTRTQTSPTTMGVTCQLQVHTQRPDSQFTILDRKLAINDRKSNVHFKALCNSYAKIVWSELITFLYVGNSTRNARWKLFCVLRSSPPHHKQKSIRFDFSTVFVHNISHSNINSPRYHRKCTLAFM